MLDHTMGYEPGLADEVATAVRGAIRQACRDSEMAALCGETNPRISYEAVRDEIKAAIAYLKAEDERLIFLQHHRHEFGDDDYCIHCGADGENLKVSGNAPTLRKLARKRSLPVEICHGVRYAPGMPPRGRGPERTYRAS